VLIIDEDDDSALHRPKSPWAEVLENKKLQALLFVLFVLAVLSVCAAVAVHVSGHHDDNPPSPSSPTEEPPPNTMFGFPMNQLTGLTSLKIPSVGHNKRHLKGTIPTLIGQLTRLQELDLSNHSLSGQLPSELALLTRLRRLDLYNNSFTGPFPSYEIGEMKQLKMLNITGDSMALTGTVGTQVCRGLPRLQEIRVNCQKVHCPGDCMIFWYPVHVLQQWQTEALSSSGTDRTSMKLTNQGLRGSIPTEVGVFLNHLTKLNLDN
jgi:hypothetical protein